MCMFLVAVDDKIYEKKNIFFSLSLSLSSFFTIFVRGYAILLKKKDLILFLGEENFRSLTTHY